MGSKIIMQGMWTIVLAIMLCLIKDVIQCPGIKSIITLLCFLSLNLAIVYSVED
jgi:hypothetical protein